jgi:hypothetical protein
MRRFGAFQALWMAFYSKALYRDVARHWPGVGFLYLLLLLALAWLPEIAQLHISLGRSLEKLSEPIVQQIPEITIREGKATVNPPGPHIIKDPEEGKELVIIDTSGQRTSLEGTDAMVLITETQLFLKNEGRGETRIYDLARYEPFMNRIDQNIVRGWLRILKNWFAVLFYVIVLPFSFIYRVLQALFYAATGMIFTKMVNVSLGYATVLRLACIAVSPAVWLATVRSMTYRQVPYFWLICFLVAMGYLFFAVQSTAQPEPATGMPGPALP